MELDALHLFNELEQTQGPFVTNVSRDATRVVQTRIQELRLNESAGFVRVRPSVTFGDRHDHNVSRFVGIVSRGSATLDVISATQNSTVLIRAGTAKNATLHFVRSNDLPNRDSLILSAASNESIATSRGLHVATVHSFQLATDGSGLLSLLGFSNRRPQRMGSLLMPTMRATPVRLMVVEDHGSVGSLLLGGSVRFGRWAATNSTALLGAPDRRSNFATVGASRLNLAPSDLTLQPVGAQSCVALGLDEFCQTGPSDATPVTGGAVHVNVALTAQLLVTGGACRSDTIPTSWTFGPTIYQITNSTAGGNDTAALGMECPAGSHFRTPQSVSEVWQIASAVEATLPELAAYSLNASQRFSEGDMTAALLGANGDNKSSALIVRSDGGSSSVNVVAGPGKSASLFIGSGARLPAAHACATLVARVNWTNLAFLEELHSQSGTNGTANEMNLPPFDQNVSVSDNCSDFAHHAPRSSLGLVSGSLSSSHLAAYTSDQGIDTLLFRSNTRDLVRIEALAESASQTVSLNVFGGATIGAQCPPKCNTSSSVQVLSSNATTLAVTAAAGDATVAATSIGGANSVLDLRQTTGSAFTFQRVQSDLQLASYATTESSDVVVHALMDISSEGVVLTGQVASENLDISGSVALGSSTGDSTSLAGSLTKLDLVFKPRADISNSTYNITIVDPQEAVCADQDVTGYGMGDCASTLAYISLSGKTCLSNLNSIGIPGTLSDFCQLTCDTCPDQSMSSRTIMFLPSVNNNPAANMQHATKVLTSVSTESMLTKVGLLGQGSIAQGFGSISTDQPIKTTAAGQIRAAGTATASGSFQVKGSSYLGGEIIEFFSFSSIAAYGTFADDLVLSTAAAKIVSLSGSDKSTALHGIFDDAIIESVEPTCPFYLNPDGSVCVLGQRDIVIPDTRPDIAKELMIIHYDYGAVNDVNQVYMSGTSGEIESHPDQLVQATHASYISVYNNLVKTSSIVLAQVSNPGYGGVLVLHAVTMMTVDGGFTITVRNIHSENDMLTTFKCVRTRFTVFTLLHSYLSDVGGCISVTVLFHSQAVVRGIHLKL